MLTNNGAQAGHDSPEIRIRGVGTFEHNDPMVLIDGVESSVSQIAEIPADDIESVSVLKDAASASIYGVRAANGVILVTTKRGGEQKPTITYSGSIALQEATVLPDYVNSYEWAKMYNECWPSKAYTMICYRNCKMDQIPIILPIPIGLRKCSVRQLCTNTICQ